MENNEMSSQRILIVEDDKQISTLIRYNLQKEGFDSLAVMSGEEVLDVLDRFPIDLVLLDIMLPKMNGFEVCKAIRQEKRISSIPIIMLTARGEETDRILGLELGANDYMVKPFSPRELILRIKTILRRETSTEMKPADILSVGQLLVDIPRHRVSIKGKEVTLTAMEFKLLCTLLRRKGRLQSREQLLNDVWNMDASITTRTIDSHVKKLRQKFGTMKNYIETVRGYGYRLKEED